MLQTLMLGAMLGGVAAFVWGAFSWMVLPWHHVVIRRFRDEDEVARVMVANVTRTGVYGLPAAPEERPGSSTEEKKAAEAALWERMKTGPMLMAVVELRGFGSLAKRMMGAVVINTIASLILTWLLLQTTGLEYWWRVAFVAGCVAAGTIVSRLSDWNWHGYATDYTVVTVADMVVGWWLVGMVIAAVV